MKYIIILVILAIAILIYMYARYYYYLIHMRSKIFPAQINQMPLSSNLSNEPYYDKFINAAYRKLTSDELIYLIKYKKYIDMDNVYSMCQKPEVDQMAYIIKKIKENHIVGSIVETGVWRGGMGMWIKNLTKYYRDDRPIYLYDTFDFFPDAINSTDKKIHPITEILFDKKYTLDRIKANFRKYNLLDKNIYFVKGLINDTVPSTNPGPISVLRLDSDYYDSTMTVLEHYYPLVSIGGYIIVDDYHNYYVGCRKAVDEFRNKYGITNPLIGAVDHGVYWEKL